MCFNPKGDCQVVISFDSVFIKIVTVRLYNPSRLFLTETVTVRLSYHVLVNFCASGVVYTNN